MNILFLNAFCYYNHIIRWKAPSLYVQAAVHTNHGRDISRGIVSRQKLGRVEIGMNTVKSWIRSGTSGLKPRHIRMSRWIEIISSNISKSPDISQLLNFAQKFPNVNILVKRSGKVEIILTFPEYSNFPDLSWLISISTGKSDLPSRLLRTFGLPDLDGLNRSRSRFSVGIGTAILIYLAHGWSTLSD